MSKIILDLCGGTGSWAKPYKDDGYDVLTMDNLFKDKITQLKFDDVAFLESGGISEIDHSIQGILAAPPCTMFAVSGNRWRLSRTKEEMKEALRVVDACIRIIAIMQPKWWALENPIGTLWRYLGKPRMYFNPCDFGDAYTKKTCLWGNFKIPKKNPVIPIKVPKGHHTQDHYYKDIIKLKNRKIVRSITPTGFAKAFFEANQ